MLSRRKLILLPLAGVALPGAEPGAEPGFEPIFDGQSLAGWRIENGPESAFYVKDGAMVVHPGSNFPTWLRSEREYENFEFQGEVFIEGWANSGIFVHAPKHGRPTGCGMKVNIFQKADAVPLAESMGAIFPVVAPSKVNVRNKAEWNQFRIRVNWPEFKLWMNGELVQNLKLDEHPELRHRLRRGYLGLESLSYPVRFRKLEVKSLPATDTQTALYASPSDLAQWRTAEPEWMEKSKWETLGSTLRGEGLGYLATKEQFADYDLEMYVRPSRHSNGGVYFRCPDGIKRDHYEIQVHDVEGAVYPTGSLYGIRRARWWPLEPESWFLLQIHVQGDHCVVRVDGETVVDYRGLKNLAAGPIALQAHQTGKWIEYKEIRIRRLNHS